MKCKSCGYETTESMGFCPICGGKMERQSSDFHHENEALNRKEAAGPSASELLSCKLLTPILLLFTIGTVLPLISGSYNILGILAVIFAWIMYSDYKKGSFKPEYMKKIGVVLKISYIIDWVICAGLAIAGFICPMILDIINDPEFIDETSAGLSDEEYQSILILQRIDSVSVIVIFLILAVLVALINIFIEKPFMKMFYRIYENETGIAENTIYTKRLGFSLIGLTIINLFYAVYSFVNETYFSAATLLCIAAAYFLVKKVLKNPPVCNVYAEAADSDTAEACAGEEKQIGEE